MNSLEVLSLSMYLCMIYPLLVPWLTSWSSINIMISNACVQSNPYFISSLPPKRTNVDNWDRSEKL